MCVCVCVFVCVCVLPPKIIDEEILFCVLGRLSLDVKTFECVL